MYCIYAPLRSSANIALNKQEIRITRYIRKRVTVLSQYVMAGKWGMEKMVYSNMKPCRIADPMTYRILNCPNPTKLAHPLLINK